MDQLGLNPSPVKQRIELDQRNFLGLGITLMLQHDALLIDLAHQHEIAVSCWHEHG